MFDYSRLGPIDFEKLCSDMMGRVLGTELRYFPPGRDGGIDLVDDVMKKNIVIQVKHYENSPFSKLRYDLKRELKKVNELQPKQYYLFTSQSLSPNNVKEIYYMFQGYMHSEGNIVTKENINEFLKREENLDILRSQFKLWITADIILKDFLNQDVFVDSEVLLSDLDQEIKYFVPTDIFYKCIEILETERKVFLCGDPGVGKTLNSKMLLLNFVRQGYKVRYSSNGEINSLKRSVTSNKNVKEIIFLDDCLGQHYFNLKEGLDQQLLSLIKHIELQKNKILILNSRVTILNEAVNTFEELDKYFGTGKISIRKINMNEIHIIEKAKIFYTMLMRNQVPNEYYNKIRKNKGYLHIVQHKNFNPRVVDFVTIPNKIESVKSENYQSFIMDSLNNPKDIWKNEFESRMTRLDRIFMYTLYSLTDTYVSKEILEQCFDYNISKDNHIDNTLYNFESTLNRLNDSVVKIVDLYGNYMVGVLNPSVNDYIKASLFSNKVLLEEIRGNIIYLNQLERLYTLREFEERLEKLFMNNELFEYNTIKKGQLFEIRLHIIAENKILSEGLIDDMEMLVTMSDITRIGNYSKNKVNTVINFIQSPKLRGFYEIDEILSDIENIESLFSGLNFEDTMLLLNPLIELLKENKIYCENIFNFLLEHIYVELEYYIDEFDYVSLVEESSSSISILKNKMQEEEYISIIDIIKDEIEDTISTDYIIESNIIDYINTLEGNIRDHIDTAFEEIKNYNNESPEESAAKTNIKIEDILDRPIE